MFGWGVSPNAVTVAGGHVWVTNGSANAVTELNAKTGGLMRSHADGNHRLPNTRLKKPAANLLALDRV